MMSASIANGPWGDSLDRTRGIFQSLVLIADERLRAGKHLQAATCAQVAALYGSYNHNGLFASAELERILEAIGHRETAGSSAESDAGPTGPIRRVLHVLTAGKAVGGDSRFVWRWVQRDVNHIHSVVVTRQMGHEIPPELRDAVHNASGEIWSLDAEAADVLGRAQALRRIASTADVVFLHVYPEDVAPILAFADPSGLPPIVFVVQADHQFWLGVGISDLVVHLRDSGAILSSARRGVPAERMAVLPIPLDPSGPAISRSEARRQLGVADEAVVLLSIARAVKYEPIKPPGFAKVATELLQEHGNAMLYVIGPDDLGEWSTGREETQGRLMALGQRSDTHLFYAAADIYIDSFPFCSNTSLLEAACQGLPLVTFYPYAEDSRVLGAGAPGLDSVLLMARSLTDFKEQVSSLIRDPLLRKETGDKTRQETELLHRGEGWDRHLSELYEAIERLGSKRTADAGEALRHDEDSIQLTELDGLLHRFYSNHAPLGWIIGWYARDLPYIDRMELLLKLLKVDRSFSFSMFLPKQTGAWLGARMRGWRRWRWVAPWLSPGIKP